MEYNLGPYRLRMRGDFMTNNAAGDPVYYKYLDIVRYNGGSYICCNLDTIDGMGVTGVLPEGQVTSDLYWQCIAKRGEKGEPGDSYKSFITVANGKWNYNDSDKIIIPDTGSSSLEILNPYDGCCGLILTKKNLQLPTNSEYSIDFNYITPNATQYYMYTFVYGSFISSNKKFIWNRTVIDQ